MFYTEWNVGEKTYKLRLTTMGVLSLEDKMGKNPADIFLALGDGVLPKIKDIVLILHQSLQACHSGMSMEKTANILDDYFAEGHNIYELVSDEIMKVFQNAGLLGAPNDGEEESESGENGKN